MAVVKGFLRQGSSVVNAQTDGYDLIKQRRSQKRSESQIQAEMEQLRQLVMQLAKRVEELERG